jgi:hypothetical protein
MVRSVPVLAGLLAGAGVVIVELGHPLGAPSVLVLAAGVVLVIAAGAAGTAIGTWFPHPLAGLLGALVLFLPTATGHLLPAWSLWLVPWQLFEDQLGWLPGPLAGYPPARAHAAELAGVGAGLHRRRSGPVLPLLRLRPGPAFVQGTRQRSARAAARPARPSLTVQQTFGANLSSSRLTYGHSQQQISQWNAPLRYGSGNGHAASAIYLGVGGWPAGR